MRIVKLRLSLRTVFIVLSIVCVLLAVVRDIGWDWSPPLHASVAAKIVSDRYALVAEYRDVPSGKASEAVPPEGRIYWYVYGDASPTEIGYSVKDGIFLRWRQLRD